MSVAEGGPIEPVGSGRQCAVERGSIEAGGSSRAARAARACRSLVRSRSENRRNAVFSTVFVEWKGIHAYRSILK